MATIVDYNKQPHELLGSATRDQIFVKGAATVIFGWGGSDEIYTPVDTVRQQIYGGISLPDGEGGFFGHVMPAISYAQRQALYRFDGNDTGHGGDNDWMVLGGGADTSVWHPRPGGYQHPGWVFGFDPEEGDTVIFAHDRGFTVDRVVLIQNGPREWIFRSADLHGRDSDPIQDGEWIRLDSRIDGRGEDNEITIPRTGNGRVYDVHHWLLDHDAEAGAVGPDVFLF